MKNNKKYIKRIGIFVLALVMTAACVKWESETSPTLGSPSTVTLAVLSAGDSSVTVSFSSTASGYVALNLVDGTGNEVPTEKEDLEALLTGNVSSMEYYRAETEAGNVYQYTFQGLIQNTSYEVLGVANNDDGVVSPAVVLVIATGDSHPPVLTGTDPEVGTSAVLPVDGSVTLIFDEPVLYDDTKDVIFTELNDSVDVAAGDVTVAGNMVTISLGEDLTNRDFALLSYAEGAFTDLSGNLVAEMNSYYDYDEDELHGLYWRAEAKDFEALTITPEEDVVPAGFDIVVTFAEEVDADDVEDGDITLTYDDGTDVLIKAVLASEVSATGNDLTITQSYIAAPGVEVTLDIPADLLGIGIGNPNAAVTASWSILHPLQSWIGSYTVDAASYAVPGDYDEVWAATIAPVAGDITSLAITIDAGNGGGVPVIASIDDGAMTITIPSGSNAGDLYGGGPTLMYVGDYATIDMVTDIVGTIVADGTILIDQLAFYIPDYTLYWDAFNSTWTPAAKKSAAGRSINAAKAARLK